MKLGYKFVINWNGRPLEVEVTEIRGGVVYVKSIKAGA